MKLLILLFVLLAGQAQAIEPVSSAAWDQPNWKIVDKNGEVLFDNLPYATCLKFEKFNAMDGEKCVAK